MSSLAHLKGSAMGFFTGRVGLGWRPAVGRTDGLNPTPHPQERQRHKPGSAPVAVTIHPLRFLNSHLIAESSLPVDDVRNAPPDRGTAERKLRHLRDRQQAGSRVTGHALQTFIGYTNRGNRERFVQKQAGGSGWAWVRWMHMRPAAFLLLLVVAPSLARNEKSQGNGTVGHVGVVTGL